MAKQKVSLFKPGYLVSCRSTLRGNIHYEKTSGYLEGTSIEERKRTPMVDNDGNLIEVTTEVSTWTTRRTIKDTQEYAEACTVRNAAVAVVRSECVLTGFGLLCPLAREKALDQAIEKAESMVKAFNDGARITFVGINVLKGRIADNDEEAIRGVADELQALLGNMSQGVQAMDVKAIRAAANKAREMEQLIDEGQFQQVTMAIDAARKAARAIVKRVQKGGEDAQEVLLELNTKPIELARFAFLEDAENRQVADDTDDGDQLPAVDLNRFDGLDDEILDEDNDTVEPGTPVEVKLTDADEMIERMKNKKPGTLTKEDLKLIEELQGTGAMVTLVMDRADKPNKEDENDGV